MSDYYGEGTKVQATRDTGGLLGSETRQGQSGTVLGSNMVGTRFEVRWDDGHTSEVSADDLKRWS